MLRWLSIVAWCYPGFLLGGLFIVSAPVLLWELASGQTTGLWEVQRWGAMPQSVRLFELLSSRPRAALGAAVVLTIALATAARMLSRWSAAASSALLSAGSLQPLPYWFFAWQLDPLAGAGGICVSLAGIVGAQRMLLPGPAASYWRAFAEALLPLSGGFAVMSLLLFGGSGWIAGAGGTAALAGGALIASGSRAWPAAAGPLRSPSRRAAALGLFASIGCYWGLPVAARSLAERRNTVTQRQLAMTADPSPGKHFPMRFFQRGVSLVADRAAFGSDVTHELLRSLAGYGVDAIGIVVHGIEPHPLGDRESRSEIELLTRRAHSLGMKVMLKPHHRPRGDDMSTTAKREAWFRRHGDGMEDLGRFATRIHADLYCVGYEMGSAFQYEAEWRATIRRVRRVYPGPLTACPSQGAEFEGIRFWDALDYIGIDNYYPLPDSYDYSGIVKKLEAVHERYGKPVLLTEAGFASVQDAHREPWAEPRRGLSLEEQARCYRAVFEALYDKPWFMGIYWWKVDTDGAGGMLDRSLTPWRKPAMEVVKRWYRGEGRR